MFSYILVVSRGYILSNSIFPVLNARKLHIIASCSILANLFKNYFKGQKYDNFLLNSTKIPLIDLCWKSRQWAL